MRIDKIEINNFRCFEHLALDFHPRLNVFVGANGGGKTSLLEAVRLCLGTFVGQFSDVDASEKQKFYIRPEDVRFVRKQGSTEFAEKTSFFCTAIANDKTFSWSREKIGRNGKTTSKNIREIEGLVSSLEEAIKHPADGPNTELPLIAYFSTDRVSADRKFQQKEKLFASRMRGYFNSLGDFTNIEYMKTWFKDRQLAKFQHPKRIEPGLDLMQKVIKSIPGVSGIEYIVSPSDSPIESDLYLIYDSGEEVGFDYLSDGTKMFVSILADIAMRCILLNPSQGFKANETAGIVLIDEVDLHLHPEWQRLVIPGLLNAFPNVQFFFTTHSPMTLVALEPYIADSKPNIFLLSRNSATPLPQELLGTANNWLTEVFGLEEPRSIEAEAAIREAKSLLIEKAPNKKDLKRTSEDLMKYIQAHDSFWVRWNYFAQQHGVEL